MSEVFSSVVGYVEELAVLCHHHQETVHGLYTQITTNKKENFKKM
jgi:hypothetical protein